MNFVGHRHSPESLSAEDRFVWRPVAKFYVLAIVISWLLWMPVLFSKTGIGLLPFAAPLTWVIPGAAGPLLAACIVQWQEHRSLAIGRVRVPWQEGITGTIIGCMTIAATFVAGTAAILTQTPPRGWSFAALGLYGSHILMTLVGGPLFEEWGWRAFAQARLQRQLGGLRAALIVGVGWGFWHLPMFLLSGWSNTSFVPFVAITIALSVLMAWGFNLSSGCIVTAILMHATFNRSSHVLGPFLGAATLHPGLNPVMAILMALTLAALVVALATRGDLACKKAELR